MRIHPELFLLLPVCRVTDIQLAHSESSSSWNKAYNTRCLGRQPETSRALLTRSQTISSIYYSRGKKSADGLVTLCYITGKNSDFKRENCCNQKLLKISDIYLVTKNDVLDKVWNKRYFSLIFISLLMPHPLPVSRTFR